MFLFIIWFIYHCYLLLFSSSVFIFNFLVWYFFLVEPRWNGNVFYLLFIKMYTVRHEEKNVHALSISSNHAHFSILLHLFLPSSLYNIRSVVVVGLEKAISLNCSNQLKIMNACSTDPPRWRTKIRWSRTTMIVTKMSGLCHSDCHNVVAWVFSFGYLFCFDSNL